MTAGSTPELESLSGSPALLKPSRGNVPEGTTSNAAAAVRIVTQTEKYCYATGRHWPMVLFGVISALLLLIGLCRFARIEAILFIAVPFVLINGTYLLLSYSILLTPARFRLSDHQQLVEKWAKLCSGLTAVSVDIFLPVCSERVETVLETWSGVQQLQWPGPITVCVLDDSPTDRFREPAERAGFQYLRREGREFRKAGNLRHAFSRTSADFILLLDADFRPRPEILLELLPYLLEEDRLAVVQSPQFFDVHHRMNWVEAGAGFVQELFYRLIQPARDRCGAGVCVGSCAVYRRTALAELGGTPAIDHSEDLWTGFELLDRGWRLKYVPVVLAKGLCPHRLGSFFTQQYRWCQGSLSLIGSMRFWKSRLSLLQKFCYIAGFAYYFATALNSILTPLPILIMVGLFPDWVHWNHLAFSLLALIYTPFVLCLWSVFPFGLHFLTTREVSGAAHLNALVDTLRGRTRDWVVTGGDPAHAPQPRIHWALGCVLGSSALGGLAIWACAAMAIAADPARWLHFLPPLMFSTLHLAICWRMLDRLNGCFSAPPWRLLTTGTSHPRVIDGRKLAACFLLLFSCVSLGAFSLASRSHDDFGYFSHSANSTRKQHDGLAYFNTDPAADFGRYVVRDAFPGAALGRVIRMREHPGEPGVYFVADFTGVIYEVRRSGHSWSKRTVVDLTGSDLSFLYSFEIHPQYPKDPRFFFAYRTGHSGRGHSGQGHSGQKMALRITSLAVPPVASVDHRQEQLLIEQHVETDEHLGGDLAFDHEHCLLISCGDNELSLHDRRSQLLNGGLFSGILRIDVDQRGAPFSHAPVKTPLRAWTANYFIPDDNPFVGQPDVLEEYWALGLRNPFRISFDAVRKNLWIGDVGQDRLEQIEVASAGTNHQWSFQEGTLPFSQSHLNGTPPARLYGVSTAPLHEYPHADLNSCIIGGVVYTGQKFPELSGRYIFGDNRSGRIWSIDPDHPDDRSLVIQLPFGKSSSTLVSINTDHAGELYFTNFVSVPTVYRLAASAPMQFPERLSETGLFTDLIDLVPAAGVFPYDVAVPFWSDGVEKRRWCRLPPGERIDRRNAHWKFPPHTVLIKHFEQAADFAHPGQGIETRVLVVREDGTTAGATYLWNAEGTDALLQLERHELPLTAGAECFSYQLPDARDCKVCHHRDNPVLGFNEAQLNLTVPHQGSPVSQLQHLSKQGVFRQSYSAQDVLQARSLAPLENQAATLETRARSYLHANCSFCHHAEGLEHVKMDLDLFSRQTSHSIIAAPAQLGYHQIDGRYAKLLIAPGDMHNSAVYQRMRTTDSRYSMPYLGRTRPHRAAIDLVGDWILSLALPDAALAHTSPIPPRQQLPDRAEDAR